MGNKYIREARISERKFLELVTMFCADVPALTASRLTLVNRKTSQRIYTLLRKRVVEIARVEAKPCSRAALEPIIKGQVLSKATVYTDGWLGYDGLLLSGYKHHRIYHHENEFARGKNHVNGIES